MNNYEKLLEYTNGKFENYENFLKQSLEQLKHTKNIEIVRSLENQIQFYKQKREYYKEINELIKNNVLLSYKEIDQLYGNLEYNNYKTEMFGNMFYVYKLVKKRFGKIQRINCIELCCACGIHKQTIIDILKSYNFKEVQNGGC